MVDQSSTELDAKQLLESWFEGTRVSWEEHGDFGSVVVAFAVHSARTHMPSWLSRAVMDALRHTLIEGGKNGRGRKGGYAAQISRENTHWMRWSAMTDAIERGSKKPSDEAAEELKGTFAQGTPRQIRQSFKRMHSVGYR